ncbi:MAG: hypothetical protein AAB593_00080 [Patescibacteria group bacterium]
MYNPEKQYNNHREKTSEFKEGLKQLEEYLKLMSEDLNKQGIPVNEDCRMNMDGFRDNYANGKIEKDKEYVEELERRFKLANFYNHGKIIHENEIEFKGKEMEMLTTAIFHKNLSTDYIVVRTSEYDDYVNKVDNIILSKKTGSAICAFDDIAPRDEYTYKEKERKTLNRNSSNGAKIKYGIRLDNKEKIILSSMDNIPIFYLALGPKALKRGIKEFNNNQEEKKLFEIFISEINLQIKKIEFTYKNLDPELKNRFNDFKKTIESM